MPARTLDAIMTQTPATGTPRPDPFDDPPDEWRHEPRPARDESAAESLGRAVSEVVTGSEAEPGGSGATTERPPKAPR